ncbi:YbjQ family protein [Stieleria varia]|uniref:UPF0145 protein Pla52n_05580 n=1 Tax=Stieleria varia TaxID=2528005 RepID=A0A5C6B968_9BACT|nr:YbjQ family protein [Stieleria varia]TWU07981.1 hypothetical protein Pla52n_05580 [Stieleria varia]
MPWTCPSCGGETELGYNICRTCKTPRPETAPYHSAVVRNDSAVVRVEMLVTTTGSLQTHRIDSYLGPVFGESIYGATFFEGLSAGFADMVGGRSNAYESLLHRGRQTALAEMIQQADRLGGNAIVGMRLDYSPFGNSMMMICCSGTAVVVSPKTTISNTEAH